MEIKVRTGRWLGDENSEDEGPANHQRNIDKAVEKLEKEGYKVMGITTNWFGDSAFPNSCVSVTRITYGKP